MKAIKAQASMEFLITLFLVILLLLIMGFFIYQKYVTSTYIKINIAGQQVANSIADNINEISTVGDGYYQNITLPASIYGEDYSVRFYKNEPTVFVYTGEMSWSAPLVTSNIGCGRRDICLTKYNDTNKEIYMDITNRTEVKLVNRCGAVLFGDYYLWREGEDWSDHITSTHLWLTNTSDINASDGVFAFSHDAMPGDWIVWNVTLPNYACYNLWSRPYQEASLWRVGNFTTWIDNKKRGDERGGYYSITPGRFIWFDQSRVQLSEGKHVIKIKMKIKGFNDGESNIDMDAFMLTTDPQYDPSSQYLPIGKPPDAWEI